MSERFEETRSVSDVAADWLVAHDRGLTQAERVDFEVWLAGPSTNAEEWRMASLMWGSFDDEPDELLASFRAEALSARPSRTRRIPAWATAAAAVVALTVGIGSWGLIAPRTGTSVDMAAVARTYSGGQSPSEVTLADGSRVMLDVGSRITVRETDARRDVALEIGRAFFKVAHDPSRPFVVASADRTVTATGTAFEVAREGSGLRVILEEGRVRIDATGNPADRANLVPGQEYWVKPGSKAEIRSVDAAEALNWRDGFISLHDITVREVLAMMDRGKPPHVVVTDPAAGDLRVSGRFRANDSEAFAKTLGLMYPVRIARSPSGQTTISSITAAKRRRSPE
ncbi:FecR family protein [Sphingomonas glacialis]|nr:FecR domain-containing protein [Sphingomonas glacialis]